MKLTTQKDIARKLNLSITAVSKALNDNPDISEETKALVRKTAKEMGYVRNFMAASIRRSGGSIVGIVCSDLSQPYYSAMLGSCESAVTRRGLQPLLFSSYEDAQRELDTLKQLASLGAAGYILDPAQHSEQSVPFLRKLGAPFVLFNRWYEENRDHYVLADNVRAGQMATEYLIRSMPGLPILCVNGPDSISPTLSRWTGYRQALEQAGLPYRPEYVFGNCFHPQDGYAVGKRATALLPGPFGALCSTDNIAMGFLRALYEQGRAVPRDVCVIGVDDIHPARFLTPALTTVALPKEEIGTASVAMLMEMMSGRTPERARVLLEPRLILRETTRPLPQ